MALTERNSLWRRHRTLVLFSHILDWISRRKDPKIPDLSALPDRMLRDIGMSPAELEEHRHKLPSQNSHHPRM